MQLDVTRESAVALYACASLSGANRGLPYPARIETSEEKLEFVINGRRSSYSIFGHKSGCEDMSCRFSERRLKLGR